LTFLPSCGQCRWCSTGHTNLCDLGGAIILGPQLDGTYRFHARNQDIGQMCLLGTFSPHTAVPAASCVVIDRDIPLSVAALVGCGVTTGWGSAVYAADAQPGDTVVVMGVGGIGINAVQGARLAGAEMIVAVDPVEFKRDQALIFGATHVASNVDEAWAIVSEATRGVMAEKAILTTDVAEGAYVAQALSLVQKTGLVVVTAIGHPEQTSVDMSLFELTLYEKQVKGALFGSANARADIPKLLRLYRSGQLKLAELITRTYRLEDLNEGYADLRAGINLRGLVRYDNTSIPCSTPGAGRPASSAEHASATSHSGSTSV